MSTIHRRAPLAALLGLLAALGAGCADPTLDAAIAALPAEEASIRPGPMHRAGQPCTLCHSDAGGRRPAFAVAGTLYQKVDSDIPIEGATIHLTDATGATYDVTSNCAGNFYVEEQKWLPTFPLFVEITYSDGTSGGGASGTTYQATMKTKIGRDTACASCHTDPPGPTSPGRVFLTSDPNVPDFPRPALDCNGRGGRGG
ncbi:MAG: hypothetical protein QM820_03415 [Minicystis sp.]